MKCPIVFRVQSFVCLFLDVKSAESESKLLNLRLFQVHKFFKKKIILRDWKGYKGKRGGRNLVPRHPGTVSNVTPFRKIQNVTSKNESEKKKYSMTNAKVTCGNNSAFKSFTKFSGLNSLTPALTVDMSEILFLNRSPVKLINLNARSPSHFSKGTAARQYQTDIFSIERLCEEKAPQIAAIVATVWYALCSVSE